MFILNMPEGYRDSQTSHLILVDIGGETFSKKDTSYWANGMQGESLKSTENCNLPKTFQTSITTFSLSSIRYYPTSNTLSIPCLIYHLSRLFRIQLQMFFCVFLNILFIEVGYCTWQFGQLCI